MRIHIVPFLLLAFTLSVSAVAQQCPETCTVSLKHTETGTKPPGIVFFVTPISQTNGTGVWSTDLDGNFHCRTCTKCTGMILFSFNAQGLCVAYNHCGLLDQGPHGGSVRHTLKGSCGDFGPNGGDSVLFEVGTCNPLFNGDNCDEQPPILHVDYSETWWIECGTCM